MWTPHLFGLLVYCSAITSHPIINKENERQTRQVDFGECCPCPGSPNAPISSSGGFDLSNPRLDTAGESTDRSEDVDDCPCRVRGTDTEAQASDTVSDGMRVVQHFKRPTESKEDLKPLLHPEVDLASSVLETIREATDEEYRDALARDAEKSTETALEKNQNTPKNIVNIILSPREDIANENDALSEASHIQEARCADLVESTNFDNIAQTKNLASEPPNLLKQIFGLTKLESEGLFHKKLLDMDTSIGSSNIQETTASPSRNKALEGLKLKSNPSLLSLFPDNNNDLNEQIIINKVPDFNLKSISQKLSDNLERAKEKNEDVGNIKRPFDFKGSLKLKNVELIPSSDIVQKALNRLKINVPNLRLTNFLLPNNDETRSKGLTILTPPKLSDLFKSTGICDSEIRQIETDTSIQVTPRNKNMKTEILDTVPSPSEMQSDMADNSESTCPCNSDKMDTSEETAHAENCTTLFDKKHMSHLNILEHDEDIVDEDKDDTKDSPNVEKNINSIESATGDDDDNEEDTAIDDRESIFQLDLSNEKGDFSIVTTSSEVDDDVPCSQKELSPSLRNTVMNNADVLNEESHSGDISNLIDNYNKNESKMRSLTDNETINEDCDTDSTISIANNEKTEQIDKSNQLSIDDLQRLSDSILNASYKKQVLSDKTIKCLTDENESKFKEVKINNDTKEDTSNMKKEDDQTDNISISQETQVDDAEISREISSEETLFNSDTFVSREHDNSDNIKEKNCSSDLLSVIPLKQNQENNNDVLKEMIAESTNLEVNTVSTSKKVGNVLESPLRQNLIVRPSPFVINPIPNVDNLLNLNTQLPTLDDIRRRLSGILGESERDADVVFVNDNSSADTIMSTDASTTNSRIAIPSLIPTENINLDIFQIKPLIAKADGPLVSKFPLLNLNSYKAKLPVPQTLDLQPLKLESTFGNNIGMLGASLRLGPDKTGISKEGQSRRKSSSTSNFNQLGLLKNSLSTTQHLDDLRASIRANAENLLNMPLGLRKNEFGKNLRSNLPKSAISNNRKSHNIVTNIQNTEGSILNEIKPGVNYAKSEDLLGMVSRTHAEVDNKLQELRSDLSNHLTSIQKSITDQQKPLSNIGSYRIETNYNRPSQTQTSLTKKSSLSRNSKLRTPQLSATGDKDRIIKNKITAASSTPVSKTFTEPLSQRISLNQNIESITKRPPINKNPISNLRMTSQPNRRVQDSKRPEPRKPFRDNKKTVSFSTTAARPNLSSPLYKTDPPFTLASKPKYRTVASPFKSEQFTGFSRNGNILRPTDRVTLKTKLLIDDTRGAPSELVPSTVQAPVSHTAAGTAIDSTTNEVNINISSKDARNPKKLAWPQFPENAFLSKVREVVRTRLSNINRGPETVNRRTGETSTMPGLDMRESASENLESMSSRNEPLKEYVSYKCRMVCSKS